MCATLTFELMVFVFVLGTLVEVPFLSRNGTSYVFWEIKSMHEWKSRVVRNTSTRTSGRHRRTISASDDFEK